MFWWLNPNHSEWAWALGGFCCHCPALECAQHAGSVRAASVQEFHWSSGCLWGIGGDLSFHTTFFPNFFCCTLEELSVPCRGSHWAQSCPSEYPLVPVLVSYPSFPSSPRHVAKIDLPGCLDLSWFINWEAVVERIRGKFQRGLSWRHLAKSWLVPDAFQLRLTERRNTSTEGEQERKAVMVICFQWLFQALWCLWAHVCPATGCVTIGGAASGISSALQKCWNNFGINFRFFPETVV